MITIRNASLFNQSGRFALMADAGVITWIGADADCPATNTVFDAGGDLLLAGFCDSHLHLFGGGVALAQLNLGAVHSADEFASALVDWAPRVPQGDMICAYAANYDLLGQVRPTRHALDKVIADRPVYIIATDFHCAWANTKALEMAGILGGSPVNGVEMGSDGLASGELQEFAAMDLVRVLGPTGGRESLGLLGAEPAAATSAQRLADKTVLRAAMTECLRMGITGLSNMDGSLYQASLLSEMAGEGDMPLHVNLPMTLVPGMDAAHKAALLDQACAAPVGRLSFGSVKMFMDGVFDTWTALRVDDYPDRKGFKGEALFSAEEFAQNCIEADAQGLQIATHAVGDGAVRAVLDGYETAARVNGTRDSRHRIEHIDMLHPKDLTRISALGVVASMQPVHPPGSSGLPLEPTISIMGRHRWGDTFAWRRIRDTGATIAFGTDWPISPLSPINALHAALSRKTWAVSLPDQRLTLAECLSAYTEAGAFARFAEGVRGILAVGQAADLVLLSGDIERLDADPAACSVHATVVAGDIVYLA